jgi:hypothetical protein
MKALRHALGREPAAAAQLPNFVSKATDFGSREFLLAKIC